MTDTDTSDGYPRPCPIDGCDRGPFASRNALLGHVNASGDPAHEWQDAKAILEGDDNGEDPDNTDADPQGSDGDSGTDDDDMPTQDEYEDQHDRSRDDDGDDDTGGSPVAALPMDPVTLGLLLAVAVGLWLTYRTLSSDDDGDTIDVDATETDDSEPAGDSEIITGGLTG